MASFMLENLQDALQASNYYEAHQLYISISQRLVKRKKYEEAYEMLVKGVRVMAEAGQIKSASDLANKLLSTFQAPWQEAHTRVCLQVLEAMPLPLSSSQSFIAQALMVSKMLSVSGQEDPTLHYEIAVLYVQLPDYYMASEHFITAASPLALAKHKETLQATFGDSSDWTSATDVLIASILRYLKKKRHQEAYELCTSVISVAVEKKPSLFTSSSRLHASYQQMNEFFDVLVSRDPLFNFAQLVTFTVQRPSREAFLKLRTQYHSLLSPANQALLDDLDLVYYDTSAASRGRPNVGFVLNDMIRGLFGSLHPPSSGSQQTGPAVDID